MIRRQRYCEAQFEAMAPERLAALLPDLDVVDLTFAAEILGQAEDSHLVRQALLPLLTHKQAIVREGAIYGLSNHITPAVAEQLHQIAAQDESPAVRECATEALDQP